ncbi:GW dipeptide domain-containing protein [Cytobacillus kochii]|uniref:GW dipeptide domain-containing protein n=1 Tax=Cytobacillus kochii TaxID=859143 RepID=UPI001CD20562|nr:GW dipeptide domain-containing protein [Cytobacillus kochii]MCA1026842.1 GW dipeptide domain-containing protein [Cytobacillus kochii]
MKKIIIIAIFILIANQVIPTVIFANTETTVGDSQINEEKTTDEKSSFINEDEASEVKESSGQGDLDDKLSDEKVDVGGEYSDNISEEAEELEEEEHIDAGQKEEKDNLDQSIEVDHSKVSEEKRSTPLKRDNLNQNIVSEVVNESVINRLGQITNQKTKIYTNIVEGSYIEAGERYANQVFFLTKQASYKGIYYYSISTQQNNTNDIIGWVKSSDFMSHPYEKIESKEEQLFINGNGKAFSKAWGGAKDLVIGNLSSYKGLGFTVKKAEKVGGNIWYQGTLEGKEVWVHSSSVIELNENNINRIGQITNQKTKIYTNIVEGSYIEAGEKYSNQVYYMKRKISYKGLTYYAISTQPNTTGNIIGWIKSTDLVSHPHEDLETKELQFSINGNGKAYSKAWGSTKDLVIGNLSSYKGLGFTVKKAEKVGSNIWYQGTLEGKEVWMHSSSLSLMNESVISRLGQISVKSVKIYTDLVNNKYVLAGDKYTNEVFYMKKQAIYNGQTYYLISTQPSSEQGVIGWVKSTELVSHPHIGLDSLSKTFYIKGTGTAYNKTWGGTKNIVYSSLASYKGDKITVNKTERVGSNIWYRGTINGKLVWVHESSLVKVNEERISRVGQINNEKVKIYTDLSSDKYITAGQQYTGQVYFLKKKADYNGNTYYSISIEPNGTDEIIGWVKSTDFMSHPHEELDSKDKQFFITGNGKAYSKAWGSTKDLVIGNLSSYKGLGFTVKKAEKVGSNIWYQGTLEGKEVWMHSSSLSLMNESVISRLGQISVKSVKIYTDLVNNKYVLAGDKYTNEVFYMKKQAIYNGQTYYLISTQPSSEQGVIGWVKSTELVSHPHIGLDSLSKTFYIKGTGTAYNKTWGGTKNIVYSSLASYKGDKITVNKTERVGSNIWYRGSLNGKAVWIHENFLSDKPLKTVIQEYSNYNLSFDRMSKIQMSAAPMTDKRYKLWIREDAFKANSIANGKAVIEGDNWNLRRGPGTSFLSGGKVSNGKVVTLHASVKGTDGYTWYHVDNTSGWVTPDQADLNYYLNSNNFIGDLKNSLQFLKLSTAANVDVNEVNTKVLSNKGILTNTAKLFIEAGEMYNVNEIYLISHALLETGNGKSSLANGIEVGIDRNGNAKMVTTSNKSSLSNIKKTYNMFGIGAKDSCALECGSVYAYESGWFSPESAIIGGAAFIGNGYVDRGQDTLYKMRWNPSFAERNNYASHQYATDIGWAFKQTSKMYEIYSMLDSYIIILDIPKYK